MASTRQLKTKIGAVRNIKQITKAMQMVAATKMRKSQEVALRARPYARKALALLANLLRHATREEVSNIFWEVRDEKRVALVVVTSDKGLCGSFNSQVLRAALRWKEEKENTGRVVEVVAVGRKGRDFFKKRGTPVAAEFFKFSDIITLADISPLADWILQAYEQKQYDKIVVCSNHFVSALVQKVEIHPLLPLAVEELERIVAGIVPKTGKYSELVQQERGAAREVSYLLEPSREAILQTLVRDLIRVAIVHLIFESNASEHSARMLAMKNATENAENMQEELQLLLNKARQGAITQELSEIVSAKEALTS
jgi:F-type H+-transporting ATPase subunit gamma